MLYERMNDSSIVGIILVAILVGAGFSSGPEGCTCRTKTPAEPHQCCHGATPAEADAHSAAALDSVHLCGCLCGPDDPTSDTPPRSHVQATRILASGTKTPRLLNTFPLTAPGRHGLLRQKGHGPPAYVLDCALLI